MADSECRRLPVEARAAGIPGRGGAGRVLRLARGSAPVSTAVFAGRGGAVRFVDPAKDKTRDTHEFTRRTLSTTGAVVVRAASAFVGNRLRPIPKPDLGQVDGSDRSFQRLAFVRRCRIDAAVAGEAGFLYPSGKDLGTERGAMAHAATLTSGGRIAAPVAVSADAA